MFLCALSAPLAPGDPLIMRCRQLSVLSVLAAAPLSNFAMSLAPPWDDMRIKHTWNAVPHNWETLGHPPAGTTIDLHLALKPHHENALIDALYAVSDPWSPKHVPSNTPPCTMYSHVPLLCCRYGAHLSREQAAQLVAPHPDTLQLINSWLQHHDLPSSSISTTHGDSWLTLAGIPVSQANEMLGASYQLYRRTGTNDTTILRTIGYALPAVLHTHVQTVVPTTYFPSTHTLRQTPRRRPVKAAADMASGTVLSSRDDDDDDDDVEVTPSDLRSLYRTFAYMPAATDENVLAIAGYEDDYPSPDDLMTFMAEFRMDAEDATFTVKQINKGRNDPSQPSTEGNLGTQYAQAMAYPTRQIYYSTGGEMWYIPGSNKPAKGDAILEWLIYVLSQPKVPQTINTSYGVPENNLPLEYAWTLCNMFAQLGARGVSVIFASGDHGVGNGDCRAKDGSGRVQFVPLFPASCMCSVLFLLGGSTPSQAQVSLHGHGFTGPYVTSVGGTTGDIEIAAGISGGGFSNYFPRPEYQDNSVPTFLQRFGSQYNGWYKCVQVFCHDLT